MLRGLVFLLLAAALCLHAIAEETGTLIWPDGTRYVGGVKDGKRSGQGTIFWKDGTRFVGTFIDDKRDGPGTMILPDGTVYSGYFKDDELMEAPAEPGPPDAESFADLAGADMLPLTNKPPEEKPPEPAERPTPPGQSPVTEMTAAVESDIRAMIELWAAAWSEQNVVQYLACYSRDFDVAGAPDREAWEALRRSRLIRPASIDVDVEFLAFEVVEPDLVEVTFRQSYRSDVYSDVTDKMLLVRKEGIYWRILRETTI